MNENQLDHYKKKCVVKQGPAKSWNFNYVMSREEMLRFRIRLYSVSLYNLVLHVNFFQHQRRPMQGTIAISYRSPCWVEPHFKSLCCLSNSPQVLSQRTNPSTIATIQSIIQIWQAAILIRMILISYLDKPPGNHTFVFIFLFLLKRGIT